MFPVRCIQPDLHTCTSAVVWQSKFVVLTLVHIGPHWSILLHIGPYWSTKVHITPHWSILLHIGPYWSTLVHITPYWSILVHIGPYYSILVYITPYWWMQQARLLILRICDEQQQRICSWIFGLHKTKWVPYFTFTFLSLKSYIEFKFKDPVSRGQ